MIIGTRDRRRRLTTHPPPPSTLTLCMSLSPFEILPSQAPILNERSSFQSNGKSYSQQYENKTKLPDADAFSSIIPTNVWT